MKRAAEIGSWLVPAVVFLLVVATFGDYGVTLDEAPHFAYGDRVLAFYLGRGGDVSTLYGAGYDLPLAALRALTALPDAAAAHLVGGLVGVLGLLGARRLGRRFWGSWGALAAVVLLATTPAYYGQMFANPKDLPFAVAYIWALDLLCAAVLADSRGRWRTWIGFGAVCGIAMAIRIAGLALVGYAVVGVIALAVVRGRAAGSAEAGYRVLRALAGRLAAAAVAAWAALVALWPWAAVDPIGRPLFALGRFSHYTGHSRPVRFGDRWLDSASAAPWDYLPRYFLMKLPEILLLLLVVGAIFGGWAIVRRLWRGEREARAIGLGLIVMAALVPPLYAMARGATIYDGVRQYLFLIPVFAVVGAGAAVAVGRAAHDRRRWLPALVVLAVAAGAADTTRSMIALHPYQYVHYNHLAGGLAGAHGRYETDYYGAAYREAFTRLADQLWETEPERYLSTGYRVRGCFTGAMAEAQLPASFQRVRDDDADFAIDFTRARCGERFADRPELLRVERAGVPLVIVRDLRGGAR